MQLKTALEQLALEFTAMSREPNISNLKFEMSHRWANVQSALKLRGGHIGPPGPRLRNPKQHHVSLHAKLSNP